MAAHPASPLTLPSHYGRSFDLTLSKREHPREDLEALLRTEDIHYVWPMRSGFSENTGGLFVQKAVSGSERTTGDRILYTTGTMGTDEVEGTVEQVVRGGENWAFVLRVERGEGDTTAILVTEPRIGALRSLETPENETKNSTVGGDTPETDFEAQTHRAQRDFTREAV